MNTNFIKNLDEIKPPKSQLENFNFVKSFCHTFKLPITKITFDDTEYDITVDCIADNRNFKFCFKFENGIPLIDCKEVYNVNW